MENELRARTFRVEFLGHSRGETVGDPDESDHGGSQDPKHACTLLTGSRDEASDFRESLSGVDLPKATRDLHFDFEHANVPLRTVMGERHLEVINEAQHLRTGGRAARPVSYSLSAAWVNRGWVDLSGGRASCLGHDDGGTPEAGFVGLFDAIIGGSIEAFLILALRLMNCLEPPRPHDKFFAGEPSSRSPKFPSPALRSLQDPAGGVSRTGRVCTGCSYSRLPPIVNGRSLKSRKNGQGSHSLNPTLGLHQVVSEPKVTGDRNPVKCAITLCAGLVEVDRAPFVSEVLVDHLRERFDPLARLLQPLQNGADCRWRRARRRGPRHAPRYGSGGSFVGGSDTAHRRRCWGRT